LTDIVADTPMYFKVSVRERAPPAKVQIQYVNGQVMGSKAKRKVGKRAVDLRVYYSTTVKEPSENQCLRTYLNPQYSVGLVTPAGRDIYDSEWVYLTMYSETGCLVNLTVVFKDDQNYNLRRSKVGKSSKDGSGDEENKLLLDLDDFTTPAKTYGG
jgi:hypothetical protein